MRNMAAEAISVFGLRQAVTKTDARSLLGHVFTKYLQEERLQESDTPAQAVLRYVGYAERLLRAEAAGIAPAELGSLVVLQDGTELSIVPGDAKDLPVPDELVSKWNLSAEIYHGQASQSMVAIKLPT